MINLIIFILASYGMNIIITKEHIFEWLRKLLPYKPLTCSHCMSVWTGIVLSFFFPTIYALWISWFIYGMISYGSYYILDILENKLMR